MSSLFSPSGQYIGNQSSNNNQPNGQEPNNQPQDNFLNPLEMDELFVGTNDDGDVYFGLNNSQGNNTGNQPIQNQPNQQPNNYNNQQLPDITQHPEFVKMQQSNAQLTQYVQQMAGYLQQQQQAQQAQNQPQFNMDEIAQDPAKLQQYINYQVNNGLQTVLQKLAPQFNQVQQFTQQTQAQINVQNAWNECLQDYPDFEQVVNADKNRFAQLARERGSLDKAYARLKTELQSRNRGNGNQPNYQSRQQRINSVENGAGVQSNNLRQKERVYDQDSRRNSMAKALADMIGLE